MTDKIESSSFFLCEKCRKCFEFYRRSVVQTPSIKAVDLDREGEVALTLAGRLKKGYCMNCLDKLGNDPYGSRRAAKRLWNERCLKGFV